MDLWTHKTPNIFTEKGNFWDPKAIIGLKNIVHGTWHLLSDYP